MRRYIVFIICMCLCGMCLYGCGTSSAGGENVIDSSVAGDYLGGLQENYSPTDVSKEAEELFPMPSHASTEVYITNLENSVIGDRVMTYSGERMEFKLITSIMQLEDDGPAQFDRVFFILVDGYLQPFYFENSDEPVLYASISAESSSELSDYEFSFDPIYVPYGENAALSFVIASAPVYYQEKATEMVYSDIQPVNYGLTACSEECAVDYEKVELWAEAETDYTVTGNESNGIFSLSEKLERADQLNINTLLGTNNQLYASTIGAKILEDEKENVRLYCVIDGELAPVFNDNYYTDLSIEAMKPYQIPLDMEKLTVKEKQQVYFIEIDKGAIDNYSGLGEDNLIPEVVSGGARFIYCVTTE